MYRKETETQPKPKRKKINLKAGKDISLEDLQNGEEEAPPVDAPRKVEIKRRQSIHRRRTQLH